MQKIKIGDKVTFVVTPTVSEGLCTGCFFEDAGCDSCILEKMEDFPNNSILVKE